MKSVFIDTNLRYEDLSYFLHEMIVRRLNLSVGDIVTAYQDNEAWKGEIVRTNGIWGIMLLSDAEQISDDRYEGQQEGYLHGRMMQNLFMIRVLQNLNVSAELIDTVKRRLDMI